MTKRIGVLTSGGDCAGLNAAIRAVTYHAISNYNWQVFGIFSGTTGLLHRPMEYRTLTLDICDHRLLNSGGTILGSTNKDNPLYFPNEDGTKSDRSMDFVDGFKQLGLDALIGIGGDGSMQILQKLAKIGNINFVGIPKTIDNDLGHTELAVGFNTAVSIATEAIDRLHPTAASHNRVIVLEVMGRDAGHIALSAGVAGGADVILIPEIPYSIDGIADKIANLQQTGKKSAVVIVAEAVKTQDNAPIIIGKYENGKPRYGGIGQYLAEKIQTKTNTETRVTVLGHVQRGAAPCAQDRILASMFGVAAVDLVANGKFDRMVAWQGRYVIDVPISQAIDNYHTVERDSILLKTAKGLGIYIGEL